MSTESQQGNRDETIRYQGKIVEIVEFTVRQGGTELRFEQARRSPGVRLIIPKDGKILLTREERHEVGGFDYRLPGGKVYDTLSEYNAALSANADIEEAARKRALAEAAEEAGIEAADAAYFGKSVCGSTVAWDLFYFVANAHEAGVQQLEEGEDITTHYFAQEEVRRMCMDGRISEERSALMLLRYIESAK